MQALGGSDCFEEVVEGDGGAAVEAAGVFGEDGAIAFGAFGGGVGHFAVGVAVLGVEDGDAIDEVFIGKGGFFFDEFPHGGGDEEKLVDAFVGIVFLRGFEIGGLGRCGGAGGVDALVDAIEGLNN